MDVDNDEDSVKDDDVGDIEEDDEYDADNSPHVRELKVSLLGHHCRCA